MSKPHKSFNVEECKVQASVLLKSLRKDHSEQAAKRFQRLPELGSFSVPEIVQKEIKRKDALRVIAIEKGFNSWEQLKCQLPKDTSIIKMAPHMELSLALFIVKSMQSWWFIKHYIIAISLRIIRYGCVIAMFYEAVLYKGGLVQRFQLI